MEIKLIELRDSLTFIPMMAIRMVGPETEAERYLLSRAGYGRTVYEHENYVLFAQINGEKGQIACDVYAWDSRTYQVAHQYLIDNWDSVQSGDVIDVEFILGETTTKKISERFGN